MGELVRVSQFSMDTPISIYTGADQLQVSANDVLRWVAPAAPTEEAFKFLMVARAMGLNPFTKEIHLVPLGGDWVSIVDKSGWIRKAEQHPQYDGHEAGIIVREILERGAPTAKHPNGPITKLGQPYDIEGACLPPDHLLYGGWAKVYRKDRSRPTVVKVSCAEYKKDQQNWMKYGCTMIRKVPLVQALRESGVVNFVAYDADEFPTNGNAAEYFGVPASGPQASTIPAVEAEFARAVSPEVAQVVDAEFEKAQEPRLDPALADAMVTLIGLLGMSEDDARSMLARRGVSSIAELNDQQAADIVYKLQDRYSQLTQGDQLVSMVVTQAEEQGVPAVLDAEPTMDPADAAVGPTVTEGGAYEKMLDEAVAELTAGPPTEDAVEDAPRSRRGRKPVAATA